MVAISLIFMDFKNISGDVMDLYGFQGSEVWHGVADGMLPLKKALLDPSWLLFRRF